MAKIKRILFLVFFCCIQTVLFAQQNDVANNKGFMESNGKIYVVVAVVVTIVAGLFLYLMNLDRKIAKLEKQA